MTQRRKLKRKALIALVATMPSLGATTALIDFGRADAGAGSPYNSAPIAGANGSDVSTGAVPLLDDTSAATGWTVTVTEIGSGNGGNAGGGADVTGFPPELAGFATAALANSIFANQGGGTNPAMTLTFSGLSPGGSYDLLLYGSRANAQGADQRWSLTEGSGGADILQFSELNSTVYVDWIGITPNASGEIEVTIDSPGPDQIGALALNFASITERSTIQLISSFSSDVDSASPGNPATLSWEVLEPLDSLSLDDGNGNTTDLIPLTNGGSGSIAQSPGETTTYTITAVRGADTHVQSLQIVSGEAPEIVFFAASASTLEAGSSLDLTWDVVGASSLTLDPGAIEVSGTTSVSLSPDGPTTYLLTAGNAFGNTTAEVQVEVIPGPLPANRNLAWGPDNTDNLWVDQIGTQNWTMTGTVLNAPLTIPSANTKITAAYTTSGGITGGSTTSYQYPELTVEVWFRPGVLSAGHQVIFETGGAQNGLSAMITDSGIRLLGSAVNARNLDLTIPTDGLNLGDFLQLVMTNNEATDEFTASVRDTFGNVRTVNETADIIVGVNGGGLFVWASGALGTSDTNLGGRTDAGETPPGLTGFTGEIAIVNVYDRILGTDDIVAAFNRVAGTAPSGLEVTAVSLDENSNELTITWNSMNGLSYDVQFSTSLKEDDWFELDGPFLATGEETTAVLALPPNQPRFFVRVGVAAP